MRTKPKTAKEFREALHNFERVVLHMAECYEKYQVQAKERVKDADFIIRLGAGDTEGMAARTYRHVHEMIREYFHGEERKGKDDGGGKTLEAGNEIRAV